MLHPDLISLLSAFRCGDESMTTAMFGRWPTMPGMVLYTLPLISLNTAHQRCLATTKPYETQEVVVTPKHV